MRKPLAALAVLALSACLDTAGATYRFQGQVQNLNAAPTPPVTVKVENLAGGALSITGSTTTPCWTDGVTVDGDKDDFDLRLTVGRNARNPCEDQRTRHHIYIGLFSNLRRGTYSVRVVDDTGAAPQVVLDTEVQVN